MIRIVISDYSGITVCEVSQTWGAAIMGDNAEDRAFQATLEQLPPELWQETIKEYERIKNEPPQK